MSIVVAPSDVSNVAPELTSESAPRVQIFIDFARFWVDEGAYGDSAKLAITLAACHLLTLSKRKGIAGSITQVKVGELQQSFGSKVGTGSDPLESTSYGQMLLELRLAQVNRVLIV